ncbi:histidine kinase dimerization/phospho-acceptor domain-containing protein [Colwellia asteriadis]|uniref:histidine kinase n=1 Tax=Colwellia asteriadis TaxID=517723 RepID=A0ABN1L8A6_9GAMM
MLFNRFSLYQKIVASLFVIFSAVIMMIVSWSQQLEQVSQQQAQQKLHLQLATHLVQDNPLLQQGVYDYDALKNLFHTLMLLGPAFEFYFVDPHGEILTYSAPKGKVKRKKINLAPLLSLIEQNNKLPIYGQDPRNIDKTKIFSVAPVYNHENTKDKTQKNLQGYLYVIIGGEAYDTIFNRIKASETLSVTAMWFIAGFIFLLLFLLALFRYFTQPMQQLVQQLTAIESARFDLTNITLPQWPSNTRNEVHQLGNSINNMVLRIDSQFKQLKQNDSQRRELLTHLSHDLRTPLASLQGYLELLTHAKVTDTPEQKADYLAISLNNTKQLKGLIDQIFELAHLESGHVEVNNERFNLGELIYDCLAKFTLKATQSGVTFNVEPKICDFMISSDIAKLERILSNLIDNALRHTPSGGNIIIKVSNQEHAINLQVCDTGTGINADEINYIFDARYRASNAKGCKKTHGGLGLAICKQLLKLLHSDIEVRSQLGTGTQFEIVLRKNSA